MSRKTAEILRDALTHFRIMETYAERDLNEQLVIDAVCMRLSAGIEALSALEPTVCERLFGDAWSLMWGMRNRIADGYLLVDPVIVKQTLQRDVPGIVECIQSELGES